MVLVATNTSIVATPNTVLVATNTSIVATSNMVLVATNTSIVATSNMVLIDIVVDTCSIRLRWWMHHSYTLLDDLEESTGTVRKIH